LFNTIPLISIGSKSPAMICLPMLPWFPTLFRGHQQLFAVRAAGC
jgi:hypothetical protein